VEKLVAGGDGLARLDDGRACFVPGAFAGDRIAVRQLESRRGYARAQDWGLLEAGPVREQPPCKLAEICGGCDWMGMRLEAQLAAKRTVLIEALRRTGKIDWEEELVELHASPESLGYRARMRLHLDADGTPGFLGRSSHQLVPIDECVVASPGLQAALSTLLRLHRAAPGVLSAFDQIELRDAEPRPSLLLMRERGATRSQRRQRTALPDTAALVPFEQAFNLRVLPPHLLRCGGEVPEESFDRLVLDAGLHLRVLPGDFSQVNWAVNRSIIECLVAGARQRELHSFADLYCGAGNFTLPLLAAGLEGRGIESNEGAIEGARSAARAQGLPDAAFVAGDAMEWAEQCERRGDRVDLVIVDAPRSGVVAGIESIAALSGDSIFVCACDPVTGSRDIARLCALGFELESLALYDMFPQTHHFEVVAWLRRRRRK
jgi:23S rRNA (uracil1939-C5)-methyltransferase